MLHYGEITTGELAVTTAAKNVIAGVAQASRRSSLAIYNNGLVNVYWGGAGVTVANGFPLLPGDSVVFDFFHEEMAASVYVIAASATTVRVVETC